MPTQVAEKVLSWATELDEETLEQARRTAALPVVEGYVALMPDAHVGIGATVGSVIPTKGAIIPSAVGVDIGCGMIAVRLDKRQEHLPDDLEPLLKDIERSVPAGVGAERRQASDQARAWLSRHRPATELSKDLEKKAASQLGTLGSGNHFLELCADEEGYCWVVLHSGSRGVGKELAEHHISKAKKLAKHLKERLTDPNLAYYLEGTKEFRQYIADMLWAQDYARLNRELMMDAALRAAEKHLGPFRETLRVNCHHNFAQEETHFGKRLWVTRKGAIRLDKGELGIVPGSMGTSSYIVRGKGNEASFLSCAHGAGRRLSRSQARRMFSAADLARRMEGRTWLADKAKALVDEIPDAYKDIREVMAAQEDLVEVVHELKPLLNYKGT